MRSRIHAFGQSPYLSRQVHVLFEVCVEVLEDEVEDGLPVLLDLLDAEQLHHVLALAEHVQQRDFPKGRARHALLFHLEPASQSTRDGREDEVSFRFSVFNGTERTHSIHRHSFKKRTGGSFLVSRCSRAALSVERTAGGDGAFFAWVGALARERTVSS